MKRLLILLLALAPLSALATPITFDLRGAEGAAVDGLNSGTATNSGLTATLTALPTTFEGRDVLLNQTLASFGINVAGTTCGSMEKSAQIDDGCTGESVEIFFDFDVVLNDLKVSIFGSSDEARVDITGSPSIDISSTGSHSLGDTFLSAGDSFSLVFVAGNGFSFDNFSVTRVTEPGTLALLGIGLFGIGLARRRNSKY